MLKKSTSNLKKFISLLLVLIGIMSLCTTGYSADTLLNTYGKTYMSGAAVTYNQLKDPATLAAIKSQYNSITIENEMKPYAILGNSPNLVSVAQAKSMGYYIPSNYTESTVPVLNLSKVNEILQICYNNGLKLRAHTLVWHGQTPDWFFKSGYNGNSNYVSQGAMDARMEYFIKNYIGEVSKNTYGKSVVYAWDVVNEYLHAGTAGGWASIYGSNLGTRPAYVKKAFQYAYDTLEYFGLNKSVKLFYNDYNEYIATNDFVSLINFINEGKKICSGMGMQSHLSTTYPSVASYISALKQFVNAGFEVQITELDVGNTSDSAQADYVYQLLSAVNSIKKAGGNISSITWWGLYDTVSWRNIEKKENALMFSTSPTTPKASYYRALQAYNEAKFK